jgi:hypothetical protein
MTRNLFWPILIIFSAIFSGLLAWSDSESAVRPIFLAWFVLVCPGMAVVGLLRLRDLVTEIVLSIALSLALGTLVAELQVLTRQWSPATVLAILIGISLVGALLQLKNGVSAKTSPRRPV